MSKHTSRLLEALDRENPSYWKTNVQIVTDSSTSDESPQRPKTRPELHLKPLKGNATGLHMKTVSSPRPVSPAINNRSVIVENQCLPTKTRRSLSLPKKKVSLDFHVLNNESSSVISPPVPKCHTTKSDDTSNDQLASISYDDDDDNSEKVFAICNNCGITTTNFVKCERCNTKLPKNPKTYVPVKQDETTQKKKLSLSVPSSTSSSEGGRYSFYKNHLVSASYIRNDTRRRKVPLVMERVNGKRAKVVLKEPTVLTLSSDDELQEVEREVEPLANGSNIENKDSNNASEESNNNNKMTEDPLTSSLSESEESSASTNNNRQKEDGDYMSTLADYLTSSPTMKRGGIAVQCRSIRIGSYKIADKMLRYPVGFTFNRISLKIPPVGDENKLMTIEIRGSDIVEAVTHFAAGLQVIFLQMTPMCASFIRTRLEMFKHHGPYYDVESEDDKIKWIVLLPMKIEVNQRSFMNMLFNELGISPITKERVHREVEYKTANEILIRSSPTHVIEKLKTFAAKKTVKKTPPISPSSPLMSRVPVIRQSARLQNQSCAGFETIATYPPPPQVGGITVTLDDMKRLNPGELINDVLIDFYLKYLYYEKLSAEDRKRTHIFSSFFYKGLNLRTDDSAGKEELAQRRHSRVKTWTRHVDLFEKDFIIIPVNENAHWFLAVICFPYLAGVVGDEESCPPPSADHDYESDSTMSDTFSQEESKTNEESFTKNEDIFSDLVSSCSSETSDVRKRPCILIFDSFSSRNCWNNIIKMLRDYLSVEFQEKKNYKRVFSKETIRGSYPKAPQQTNSVDCGLYVLQYAESFFEKPIKNFTPPIQEVQKWFTSDYVVRAKRKEIGDVILRLHAEQSQSTNNCQKVTKEGESSSSSSSSSPPATS